MYPSIQDGLTALMVICGRGNGDDAQLVQELLDAGADATITDMVC